LGVPFRHDMVRQWRAFEMTEFEWFHTPFFLALVALICANIVVTTLRRIRFNAVNLGVWMIHTGILILAAGSVVYFSTKIEGDTPVIRRDVVINLPGAPEAVRLAAIVGSAAAVRTERGEFTFSVAQIDPAWELMSADDSGKRAFAVSVQVTPPDAPPFVRQLLDGYPQYTEDVIPGRGRVKKLEEFAGRATVDDSMSMSLEPRPQRYFWLKESAALYVRPAGEEAWVQRPIRGLPRYNDYVSSVTDDIWPPPPDPQGRPLTPRPLDIPLPAPAPDALAGAEVRVTGFLRFAVIEEDWAPGGDSFSPLADVAIETAGGASSAFSLAAFDPARRDALEGRLAFRWVETEDAAAEFTRAPRYRLTIRLPDTGEAADLSFTRAELPGADAPFTPLGDGGFAYKVQSIIERLPLSDGTAVALALVDIHTPDSKFTRWVFADPSRNRDNHETAPEEPHKPGAPDPRIETVFTPPAGAGAATLTVIAGPGPVGLRVVRQTPEGAFESTPLRVGQRVQPMEGLSLTVRRLFTDARLITRPRIVPWRQRDKDADAAQSFALVRVEVREPHAAHTQWLPLQRYAFDDPTEAAPVLSRNEPWTLTLTDGRRVELAVARERRAL
ncbi:MAG TPA: hypothetical protein DEB06_07245, partial [Phycisphaerales bacterium]|nr:hypothetical protein [Phycisphaerales bacterium]